MDDKKSQSSQNTITDKEKTLNVLNNSENKLPNTTIAPGGQGQKVSENSTPRNTKLSQTSTSLQTVQITGDNSTGSQRDANSSMPKIAGEMLNNKFKLGGQTSPNSSQVSDSFHNKNATSQQSAFKPNGSDNSTNQVEANPLSMTVPQGSYADIYKESPPLGNKPLGDAAVTSNASNLTPWESNVETLKSNVSNTSSGINADDLTEIVNSPNGNIALKSVGSAQNISETTKSTVDNGTEIVSIIMPERSENTMKKSSVQSNINGEMVPSNASGIRQAGLLNTNDTKTSASEVASGINSSLSVSGGSETVDKLDRRLNFLQNSDKDRGKPRLKIERFSLSSGRNDNVFVHTGYSFVSSKWFSLKAQ